MDSHLDGFRRTAKGNGYSGRGHLICLKNFSTPSSHKDTCKDRKEILIESVTKAGKDRIKKKSMHKKLVSLGWMHFDESKQSFKAVRAAKGGGARQYQFDNSATYEQILTTATKLFFSRGKNLFGRKDNVTLQFGNYKGEVINKTSFTIQEYITKHRLSKTRIYLTPKRKSHAEIMNEIAQITFHVEC